MSKTESIAGRTRRPDAIPAGTGNYGTDQATHASLASWPAREVLRLWHSWPVFLARYYVRQTWRDMPGPWPVKVALIVITVAIPGPQDEIALIALTRIFRAWRARQARR
jgi:hypothetical protein